MDEIARLLDDLAAGHMTAAVPLLDIFREEGMWSDVRGLAKIVSGVNAMAERGYEPSYLRGYVASEVRRHFWHLAGDRNAWLVKVERYMLGPDPEPYTAVDGDSYPQAEPPHPGWAALGSHSATSGVPRE